MTFIVVVALGVLTYHNTSVLLSTDRLVADSYRAREVAESLLSSLKGVETSHGDLFDLGLRAGSQSIPRKQRASES